MATKPDACGKDAAAAEPATTQLGELDLVFAFDCTGSMGAHLQQAQVNVKAIARQIIQAESASVRMALVAYRDHPPQDCTFETEVLDFTPSIDEMEARLMTYSAQGGGDGPECVADALYQVSQLTYRPNAAKVCILIADAPPHGLGESGDGFPNGSPNGHDPYAVSRRLAAMGVTVYCVGVEPVLSSSYRFARTFFESVAEATHGQYVTLGSSKMLASVIIGGAAEELALERLMAAARKELEEGARSGAVCLDDEVACKAYLSEQIKAKGLRSKQLHRNGKSLERHSEQAKEWSRCESLSEVREKTASIPTETRECSDRMACGLATLSLDSLESLTSLEHKACDLSASSMRFASSAKKKSGGFSFGGLFGGMAAAPKLSERRCSAPMPAAPIPSRAAMPMADESDAWTCAEAEVSEEQCERLYSRIRSRA